MKRSIHVRYFISLLVLLSLMSPVSAYAFVDGKKHFKQGMKHEVAEEWDKAVEEFALAVSDNPKNPEYRLHLTRSLFNASQMYMKKGTAAAKEKDYENAYTAFRRAYAFDPTNELARSEMERMVRLQKDVNEAASPDKRDDMGRLKPVPTGYTAANGAPQQLPQKLEKLRDIPFPNGVDLQFIIKELARDLDLNVLFDVESFRAQGRKTNIDLKNVTAARALDYIFLQEGLFFQKVGPRTILVALQTQRQKFQQLVLRTFYLANAAPKDVAKVVQTAIPAQPGRSQTIVLTDDATNSVTIRDTEENIRLIGKLISSLDKDRAEVVMDVAIYEVTKTDLLKLGNQIGITPGGQGAVNQLNNLGGTGAGAANFAGNFAGSLATSIASGVLIPSSVISAFQSRGNTKLLASTQIHAFNNEDSSARIGQRVPVQSAQFVTGNTNVPGGNGGVVSNVINYEQVGLTLKFKPIVFPNQDVQVAMEIESKDVAQSSNEFVPIFTERTIKGTARIQNNKTLLLASVAQGSERNGRAGLPILGWLPLIGRLFSTPTKDNQQVDIVIAVTPRVIRAPAILPEDEAERPTGSLAVPTNGLLEAMIIDEERQEMIAAARRMPNTSVVQLPDRAADAPEYVRTETSTNATPGPPVPADTTTARQIEASALNLKPIDSGVKTLQLNQTSDTAPPVETVEVKTAAAAPAAEQPATPTVDVRFKTELRDMKAGEKVTVPVMIDGSRAFGSAIMGLRFDDKKLAVRSVSYGDVFGAGVSNMSATPWSNKGGRMFVSLTGKDDGGMKASGILAFIEIEALVDGRPEIVIDRDVLNFLTSDGKNFVVRLQE